MNIRHYLSKVIAIATIAVLAAANSCFGTVLNVPQYNQEQTQWCWDASSQMILAYYGKSHTQTAIANWAVGGQNLPNYLYSSPDWRKDCKQVLSYFGSLSSTGYGYAFSLSTLAGEMDAGRPCMIAWSWSSGGGHAVVIHGTSGSYVYVRDPWYGATVNTYTWVYNARNAGRWTQTLKLNSSINQYYAYYQQYMIYVNYYLNRYASTRSYADLYYTYYYYAYAGYYYYMSYGQTSAAASWFYYYQSQANQVLVNYYYVRYSSTGSHTDLGYCYYYCAYTFYYYYMSEGNSYYANAYYNYYMWYANYYWSH